MTYDNGRVEVVSIEYRVCGADNDYVYPDEIMEVYSMAEAMELANEFYENHEYVTIEAVTKYKFCK